MVRMSLPNNEDMLDRIVMKFAMLRSFIDYQLDE